MKRSATGGTISVANRRSTRQAQLWHETAPCCDEEYDRTKLNTYAGKVGDEYYRKEAFSRILGWFLAGSGLARIIRYSTFTYLM